MVARNADCSYNQAVDIEAGRAGTVVGVEVEDVVREAADTGELHTAAALDRREKVVGRQVGWGLVDGGNSHPACRNCKASFAAGATKRAFRPSPLSLQS